MPFTKLLLVGWRLSGRTEVAFVIIICMYTYIFVKYKAYILKFKKIGGVYSWGQKDWRKKYENGDDKKSRQEYINHEIYDKMAYLIKNMIVVYVFI